MKKILKMFSVITTLLFFLTLLSRYVCAPLKSSFFRFIPIPPSPPKLVLVSGCTGTGKSTFGMNIALSEGILKCVSTDSIREIMRKFDDSDALHRSSYQGKGDPVNDWLSACHAIDVGLYAVMDDAIKRGQSLVVEGVHIIPSNELIERWNASGGDATGVLIKISNEDAHRDLIFKRGELLKKGAERQLRAFERIRAIQNEMISRAEKYGWGMIEQELLPPAPY